MTVSKENVMAALKEVIDPEIGVSLVEMGLIKDVVIDGDTVKVTMTLTTPGCPLMAQLINSVEEKVKSLEGVKKAEVKLVF